MKTFVVARTVSVVCFILAVLALGIKLAISHTPHKGAKGRRHEKNRT